MACNTFFYRTATSYLVRDRSNFSTKRRLAIGVLNKAEILPKRHVNTAHPGRAHPIHGRNPKYATITGFAVGIGITAIALYTSSKEKSERVNCAEQVKKEDHGLDDIKDDIDYKIKLDNAIRKAKDCLIRKRDEMGIPGMSVAVTVDGKEMWSTGIGFSDVENRVKCHSHTVMRIASISKSLTMVAVARLLEEGKLNLDTPIQEYVPSFPEKTHKGEKVTITTRHLVSHLSGIRHYSKEYLEEKNDDVDDKKSGTTQIEEKSATEVSNQEKADKEKDNSVPSENTPNRDIDNLKKSEDGAIRNDDSQGGKKKKKKRKAEGQDGEYKEFLIKEKCDSVTEALKMFQNDPLKHKPGTKYAYTTHGWTVVSAVVEAASKEKFVPHMKQIFKELGLDKTGPDEHEPLIYNRTRYYNRKDGKLMNAPYVDVSYKWAGGGFISDVHDLTKFGNAMLYSYQYTDNQHATSEGTKLLPGYLKPETLKTMWTEVKEARTTPKSEQYSGMGWFVVPETADHGCCRHQQYYTNHTGGAMGASSVLLILPSAPQQELTDNSKNTSQVPRMLTPPQGVVVAILANLDGVGMRSLALEIAQIFQEATRK
ncbi:serine beta-lactamase-like protein LACTB, mitochondrial [Ptychodera flava]|uniref:serine beta-lactamase-like protein LACTB, mitochondrial n=1 Tax=Ptychodera flava TaxID=63121 RepID=UPI003969CAE1